MEQDYLDGELFDAIGRNDIPQIKSLIARGANLLAIVELVDYTLSQPCLQMFSIGNAAVIDAVFAIALDIFHQTKGKKNILDLDHMAVERLEPTMNTMNLLQAACLFSPHHVKMIIQYAKETSKNVPHLLNQQIITPAASINLDTHVVSNNPVQHEISFAHRMIGLGINVYTMRYTCFYNHLNQSSQFTEFWDQWINLPPSKKLPEFKFPLELTYHGAPKALEYLIDSGANPENPLLPDLVAASRNPEIWKNLRKIIPTTDLSEISEPRLTPDKRVCFDATLTNLQGCHKIKATITLNFDYMNNMINRKIAERKEAARISADTNAKILHLYQQQEELTKKVDSFSEHMLGETRTNLAKFPQVLDCFNLIYDKVKTHIDARKLATTQLFTIKPNTREAKIAQTAQTAFEIIGQGVSLPFIGIVPSITRELISLSTQSHAKKQSNAVFNAFLGKNTERIAIEIAAMLSSEAMKHYGSDISIQKANMIANLVIEQIDLLYAQNYQFENETYLEYFLIQNAFDYLSFQAAKKAGLSANNSTIVVSRLQDIRQFGQEEQRSPKPKPAKRKGWFGCCFG